MANPFLGEIRLMSFVFAPRGWALCNGQLLPINQNQALFSLFGTTYGGNGQINFALPDLRGRVPMHFGNGHTQGERAGEVAHTLTISELPAHNHAIQVSTGDTNNAATAGPNNYWGQSADNSTVYNTSANAAMAAGVITNQGGSQAHANMQPYLVLSFCVALQGIFPSQS
ncbi:MAG: phage tail protein [Acidobacteria bacterium]|nr:phage tail protein [Acidobacteriota bacterium]